MFIASQFARRIFSGKSIPPNKIGDLVAQKCAFSTSAHSEHFMPQNALYRFISDKIRSSGPITVAEFMQFCISSECGYYSRKEGEEIFGEKGDFVTAPELSQIFGELIGAWILNELHMSSWNGPWQLVELGPGSGALMVDILGVLNKLKCDTNLSVHFVEKSEKLIEKQKQNFEKKLLNKGIPMAWHDKIEDIPNGFTVFIANEFLDALPIHQFVRNSTNPKIWHEIYVNLEEQNAQKLCFMLSKGENVHTRAFLPDRIRHDPGRIIWEFCPSAHQICQEIVKKFTQNGGFALLMDYGHDGSRKEHSLRAYRRHCLVNPLEDMGQTDLTADVDFGELRRTVGEKCLSFGPVEQREFLSELGLALRVEYLLSKCGNEGQRNSLISACKMLVSESEMGTRFKAFSMFPSTLSPLLDARGGCPAGFASTILRQKTNEN